MSCCSETDRLPDTSPAKMSLFKMSKELHFRICNYGKSRTSPHRHGREIDFFFSFFFFFLFVVSFVIH